MTSQIKLIWSLIQNYYYFKSKGKFQPPKDKKQ